MSGDAWLFARSKSVAIDVAAGTLQTFIDNPEAGMAELMQAGKENIAAALGLHIAGRGAGYTYGKAKELLTREAQPGAGQAPAPGPAPTPAPPPPHSAGAGTGGTGSSTAPAPAPAPSSGGSSIPGTATPQGSPPPPGKPSSTTVNGLLFFKRQPAPRSLRHHHRPRHPQRDRLRHTGLRPFWQTTVNSALRPAIANHGKQPPTTANFPSPLRPAA